MVTQLAREFGAYVIGTGRAADRQTALDFGAQEFVDLDNDALEDVGGVDLVFDVIGGDIQKRSVVGRNWYVGAEGGEAGMSLLSGGPSRKHGERAAGAAPGGGPG